MVQTEAQKRAKAKYYAKLRENEEYKKNMAQRTRDYYQQNKERIKKANLDHYSKHQKKEYNIIGNIGMNIKKNIYKREVKIENIKHFIGNIINITKN